ncbi:hypothetical protein OA009_02095 [Paracoccaceae bacterium]|nr:hypothetical protein [Paracoccaceae bacterium]
MLQKIINKFIKKIGKVYLKKKALEETRSPELLAQISNGSLLNFYGNTHSQIGQDGILQEIFKKLDIKKGFFCEFGAWDGIYLSNCRKLVEEGWAGVFIEGNKKKFKDLSLEYQSFSDIHCISAFVGAPKRGIMGDPLFKILENNNINPARIDFLSIDIDGCDLEIFEEINFKPKVVLLEGGLYFNPKVMGRAAVKVRNRFHHPLREIINTVKSFEYIPVCFLHDLYLVRKDLAKQFIKFDVDQLYTDSYLGAPKWLRSRMDDAKTNKVLEREHIRLLSKN